MAIIHQLTISRDLSYSPPSPIVVSNTALLEEQNAQEQSGTIEGGYAVGNILGCSSQVFNSSFVSIEIENKKAKEEALLALNVFEKKTAPLSHKKKKTTPQETISQESAKPEGMLPPSLRADLWQYGEFTEREQRAGEKHLNHFSDEEKHFLKQQLGKVGHHFTTFEQYRDAEKLREPFEIRLFANDPPPPSEERVKYVKKEIDHLEQGITLLNNDINALRKKLTAQEVVFETGKKPSRTRARKNVLENKVSKLTQEIELKQQLLEEKRKLLLERQKLLSLAINNSNKPWSPLTQFSKDNARRSQIYRLPTAHSEEHLIELLKEFGTLRRTLYKIKQDIQKNTAQERVIGAAVLKVAETLLALVQKTGNNNDDLINKINSIRSYLFQKHIQPKNVIYELEDILSQIYQQHLLQGREAPQLYKKRKNKDEILTAFNNKFGEERFAEMFISLQSFLQETLFLTHPLEIVGREKIRNNVKHKRIDLSEHKVSEFLFCHGSLLETKTNERINQSKESHTLVVDTYLKNRLPFALIHLLQTDSSPCLLRLFPDKPMGTSQVKFFFGELNQAVDYYRPTSITKISGGGSEFYLFETYQDREIEVVDPQKSNQAINLSSQDERKKTKKEFSRFYNYFILIFDVPSIESLEHQLYQLRYSNIPVLDMRIQGNVTTYTEKQVNTLAFQAKRHLETGDRIHGPAIRVLLLGNTRSMLTGFAQYVYPGRSKDEAFKALKSEYITPGNPTFALNYARVSIPSQNKTTIPIVLLALRMPNGSLAGKVAHVMLTQARVDYLVTVGAGGSINYETPIGGYEFIHKSCIYDRQGNLVERTSLNKAFQAGHVLVPSNAKASNNVTVSGPLLETRNWLDDIKKKSSSISNVDVESFHILKAFNQAPQANVYPYITPALFISDHVGREGSSLSKTIGKTAYKDAYLLVEFVIEQIRNLYLSRT